MFTERFYTIYQAIERAVIFETLAIENYYKNYSQI